MLYPLSYGAGGSGGRSLCRPVGPGGQSLRT